ncbi:FAD-binding oxidoreductase [Streptomyces minutiscleroticus]|uniref:FAD-linked oxidase n=1 Tax=Streptomyces minutiscleroticus TaxID=68238 RepID=A0A918NWC9_9ACTN|nr:FAD-binding oxidoreductase [Streptomyces minutiscleroticus]GGY00283.1 FAD-linked oxidase [Streptomyces minutiscleroticus]
MSTDRPPRPALLAALRRDLSGHVLERGDPRRARTLALDNGRVRVEPALVILPRSAADVGAAVRFARDQGLPLTVRGGGHGATGQCLNRSGVVLDTRLMRQVRLDRDRQVLRAGAGALWEDLHAHPALRDGPLVAVGASTPQVGVAGSLLGGAYSFVSRSYGLGSDSLEALELITPEGTPRTVGTHSADPADRELFWASRGGGGGNFGVVTALELRVHRLPAGTVCGSQLVYPLERAREILPLYDEWIETVPDGLTVYCHLSTTPGPTGPGRPLWTLTLTSTYDGGRDEAVELLRPLLRLSPLRTLWRRTALPAWEREVGALTAVAGRRAYIRSGHLPPRSLTPDVVDVLLHFMECSPSPHNVMMWTHSGGAVARAPEEAGACAHRDSRLVYTLKALWDEESATRSNVSWAYDFGEALRPYVTGAFVCQLDPLQTRWRSMYYGAFEDRLLAAKRRFDPDGFFRFRQSVDSSFEPTGTRPLDLSVLEPAE